MLPDITAPFEDETIDSTLIEINELFTEKFNYNKPLNENCFVSISDLTNQNILNDAILFIEDFFTPFHIAYFV